MLVAGFNKNNQTAGCIRGDVQQFKRFVTVHLITTPDKDFPTNALIKFNLNGQTVFPWRFNLGEIINSPKLD